MLSKPTRSPIKSPDSNHNISSSWPSGSSVVTRIFRLSVASRLGKIHVEIVYIIIIILQFP